MDCPGFPGGGFGDEAIEESSGGGADVVAALGVPLDAEDKVSTGIVGVLTALDGFDDCVLRTAGGDAEAVAGNADGLMMARVHRQAKEVAFFRSFFLCEKTAEKRFGGHGCVVGDGDAFSSGVIHRDRAQVLHQRAAAPGVENLDTKADGEERLVEVVRVLKEKLVDVLAGGVGWGAFGDGVVAVFVRVDVRGTAGEKDGLTGVDELDGLDGGEVEGDGNRFASAALDA